MFNAVYEAIFFGPTTYVVVFVLINLAWLYKFAVARRYEHKRRTGQTPTYPRHEYTVSTIVPYAGEDAKFFIQALKSVRAQEGLKDHKIYVYMDAMGDPDANDLEALAGAELYADRIWKGNHKKKRFNLNFVVKQVELRLRALGEELPQLMHLMDSDTYFPKTDVLYKMSQPFADSNMGGGTTAQQAHLTNTSAERTGNLLEWGRRGLSLEASNEYKAIPCLPGRSIMLRWEVASRHMTALANEHWGMWVPHLHGKFPFVLKWEMVECYAGDDRFLTDMLHLEGYDTFFMPDAVVETLLGETRKKMYKQWWRWNTTSQHSTLRRGRAMLKKKPTVVLFHTLDTFSAIGAVFLIWSWAAALVFGNTEALFPLSIMLGLSFLSMSLMLVTKNWRYFRQDWWRLLDVPATLYDFAWAVHFRVLALFTPWRVRTWGTRVGVDDHTEKVFVEEHYWER